VIADPDTALEERPCILLFRPFVLAVASARQDRSSDTRAKVERRGQKAGNPLHPHQSPTPRRASSRPRPGPSAEILPSDC
jgi:hypothetical protein